MTNLEELLADGNAIEEIPPVSNISRCFYGEHVVFFKVAFFAAASGLKLFINFRSKNPCTEI